MFAKISIAVLAVIAASASLTTYASDEANTGRRPEFQKRIDREMAAEDARDRNIKIQEQQRLEQLELKKLRKERADQRAAQREAAKQQPQ